MNRVSPRAALALAVGFACWSPSAHAYIDPGTGSALFYVITGLILSVYFAVRGLYYRLVEFLFRVRQKGQSCTVAIHCEDPRYEMCFLPVLRELVSQGIEPTLFTMYPRDESFAPLPAGATHRAIAPGMVGYAYLNNIQAAVLVTTTPQLDVMTFRRSKRVRHYVMLQHALGESRFVRPYAYDYFDTVLCCGEILMQNIRRMEALRGARAKALLETGLPHYEELLERARSAAPLGDETVVLVAPSWGPLSMFEAFGTGFAAALARKFKVVVRPHPQMKVSQPGLYAEILALEGVEVDTERTPSTAMARAHILLSDISGIAHEFAFIHERPVVVIDRKLELGGLEGELLGGDSDLKRRCAEFIVPVPPTEMPGIVAHLERVLANHSAQGIRKVRGEVVYNFGTASAVAARQIADIYRRESALGAQPAGSLRSSAPVTTADA
jgi:hypothetical protein